MEEGPAQYETSTAQSRSVGKQVGARAAAVVVIVAVTVTVTAHGVAETHIAAIETLRKRIA